MEIKKLLENSEDSISKIIRDLPKEFDSHQFIQRFSQKLQIEYAESVKLVDKEDAFRNAHSIIGRYLSDNSEKLGIIKLDKVDSQNIFGNDSSNQMWRRVDK